MRIAIVAPLEMRVPPVAYGGTEAVVHALTEALISRGHDVTLFASGDSVTAARLVPGSDRFLGSTDLSPQEKRTLEQKNVMACLKTAGEFDIIHNHSSVEGMAILGASPTPVLTTLHNHLRDEGIQLFRGSRGWYYNTISHSFKRFLPERDGFAGVIYNGIDCNSFLFNPGDREGYLFFLASLRPQKAPHVAIEVAKRLGHPLLIAGNVREADREYVRQQVEPEIDGTLIRYFGEANAEQKRQLLIQAHCLIAPVNWPEPFGLYLVEAMASGVPVVAFNRGAIPEVVSHETGFVVDPGDVDGMVAAVEKVPLIDRGHCRRYVQEKFSVETMTDAYERMYRRILCKETRGELSRERSA